MKKVLLVLILLVGAVSAQKKITMSAGGSLALPMGDFGNVVGVGFGATVGGEMPLTDKIIGTATLGYLMWGGKELDLGLGKITTDFSSIPILVGAKYYFNKGFYGIGQLGFHMFTITAKSTITFFGSTSTAEASESTTEFTIGIGGGYEIGNLDLSAAYYLIKDANYLGARVAYRFGL
jgi:hypothetical protein